MSDDSNKKQFHGNPLDPTTNAAGMMGDPSGLTGITGSMNDTNTSSQIPSDTQYDKQVKDGMSDAASNRSNDLATDIDLNAPDFTAQPPPSNQSVLTPTDDQSHSNKPLQSIDGTHENYKFVGPSTPSMQGELAASGSTPDPESDDDTLANAQAMGMQLNEDTEHPEELDIARDIDEAEESLLTH